MAAPERLKILVLLPARRRWPWHDRLSATLAESHDVAVASVDSPAYPLALRLSLRPSEAPVEAAPNGTFDLVMDLSEDGPASQQGRIVRPLYDGSADTLALIGRLQRGECPMLDIVEGESVLVSSYAAIGDSGRLDGRLEIVFARIEAMLLRACSGPGVPVSRRPEKAAAAFSLPSLLKSIARRLVGRLLAPVRSARHRRHWNVALKWDDRPVELEGFDLASYAPLPIDPEIFYADPFVIERDGRSHLFAEACPYATGKGVIVAAEVAPGGAPGPFRTVLEHAWHLSYPYVFTHEGETYLMPESSARGGVDIHRAVDFPERWELAHSLLEGVPAVDATLFEHDGRLWLLAGVATPGGSDWDELFAWHAPALAGPWTPHALNPVKSDCRSARPGGRPIRMDGQLLRPAQRCEKFYGEALVWLEIRKLSPEAFEEVEIAEWRAAGLGLSGPHSADLAARCRAIDYRCELPSA